ncbi:MAG: amidohydrolase [Nanoarchaeota archaeon]
MSILIRNVLFNGNETNILIKENKISKIGIGINEPRDLIIEGKNKVIIPGFVNTHSHAAMSLLRGYADDMPLKEWLETKIWPMEAKLTEDDIYIGTKLACLEMIKSGTTCFNDMYHKILPIAMAVNEMGMRACLSEVFFDSFGGNFEDRKKEIINNIKSVDDLNCKRISISLGPHSIYTVSKEALIWTKNFALKNGLKIHIHLSETEKEVNECIKKYKKRPVEYLDEIGFLDSNVIAAHCVWLNDDEINILSERKVNVSYNPVSNMKLGVGKNFPYKKIMGTNICFGIGTDGACSNNSLDIFDSMKFASLLQKHSENEPQIAAAQEIFNLSTVKGAEALGIMSGKIEEGYLADVALVDLNKIHFVPNYNFISNLVYSANGSCISDVIIDGKIVMQNYIVENENLILDEARKYAKRLNSYAGKT